jgi:hypothetical protein
MCESMATSTTAMAPGKLQFLVIDRGSDSRCRVIRDWMAGELRLTGYLSAIV